MKRDCGHCFCKRTEVNGVPHKECCMCGQRYAPQEATTT